MKLSDLEEGSVQTNEVEKLWGRSKSDKPRLSLKLKGSETVLNPENSVPFALDETVSMDLLHVKLEDKVRPALIRRSTVI